MANSVWRKPQGGRREAALSRAAMSFVAFSWGMAYVAVKYLLGLGWSPYQVALMRVVLPGLALAPIALRSIRERRGQAALHQLPQLFGLGLVGFGVSHFAVVWGQQETTAAVTGLLSLSSPLTALLLALALRIDRFSWSKLVGAGLSIAGVTVVVLWGRGASQLSARHLAGPLLILVGFAVVGVYNNAIRPLHRTFAPVEVSALTAFGPALVGLLAVPGVFRAGSLGVLNGAALAAMVWLGLAAGAAAILCSNYAVSKIGPSSAASFLYLNPVVSITGGWLLLGEAITAWLALGAGLILSGLILANRRATPPTPR